MEKADNKKTLNPTQQQNTSPSTSNVTYEETMAYVRCAISGTAKTARGQLSYAIFVVVFFRLVIHC